MLKSVIMTGNAALIVVETIDVITDPRVKTKNAFPADPGIVVRTHMGFPQLLYLI